METDDMGRACDDVDVYDLAGEEDRPRCDGCGGVLEPWDAEPPVIYDCFHALHAGCADDGRDDACCPRCHTPRWVHDDDDDDDQPEPVEEAAAVSPPDNNNPGEDEDSALATSDGMGMGNDHRPRGGETGEPKANQCDGDGDGDGASSASMSGSGCNCNHASRIGCCACSSRRVAELESRLREKSAALTETTNVLEKELERAQSRLSRLEEMYDKLEAEFIRLRKGKRAREIEEDAEEEAAERRKERFKVHTTQDHTEPNT